MYIRFVVNELDSDSHKRLGIFHAIRYLRDDGELTHQEEDKINKVMDWFADNLDKPSRLSKSSKNHTTNKAITWFKHTANIHINKMWEIVSVLRSHGISVDVIKTEKPGYIVYEDQHQVAAEAFKETQT